MDWRNLGPPLSPDQQQELLLALNRSEGEKKKLERQLRRLEHDRESIQAMYQNALNLRDHDAREKDKQAMYNKLLLEVFPTVMFVLDRDLRYTLGTDALICEYFKFSDPKELVALPINEILRNNAGEEWVQHIVALCEKVLTTGKPLQDNHNIPMPDGERTYLNELFTPVFDADRQIQGLALTLHDVTELVETRDQAEEASRSKTSFLANMSHEMRTPLNAIIGMTAIAKATEDPQKKQESINKIETASNHLLGVINDVLDLSKIEADKLELSVQACPFERILQTAVGVNTFRLEDKKLIFEMTVDEAIPSLVETDEQRLVQVLTNLMSNAVKFTPEKGRIQLDARLIDSRDDVYTVEISVQDSGIGISEEQQAKLFQPFSQADSSVTRQFGGTGLGLVISKRIVELMGGRIWAQSQLGAGSRFAMQIPFMAAQPAAPGEEFEDEAAYSEEALAGIFAGYRILLAEDIELNREIAISLLEPTGVAVVTAVNGRDACEKFGENPDSYDLILMDIQMPEMDGYQAARAIRGMDAPQAAGVPIIAMTANVFSEDIQKSHDAGMNDHVGKPIDIAEFFRKLRQYLPGKPV